MVSEIVAIVPVFIFIEYRNICNDAVPHVIEVSDGGSINGVSIFQEAEVKAITNIKRKAIAHNEQALIKLTTETEDLIKEATSTIAEHSNIKAVQDEVLATLTRAQSATKRELDHFNQTMMSD